MVGFLVWGFLAVGLASGAFDPQYRSQSAFFAILACACGLMAFTSIVNWRTRQIVRRRREP